MSNTAAAQLRRILHVIPRLANGEPHSLASVAAELSIDVATLTKDLNSIVERLHEPGGFVEAVQVFIEAERVSLVSSHFLRPMRLTISELCALELGLAMLGQERPDEREVIDGARARLRQLIAAMPSDSVAGALHHASIGAAIDPAHLAAARSALLGRRRLELRYKRADAREPDDRVIEPYALVAASGMFYIVAHCVRNNGLRIFRLDRVESARVMQDRFTLPDSFSLDSVLVEGKAMFAARAKTLRVRYSSRIARWIAEREGLTVAVDGSLTVDHAMVDPDWGIRHVLQYGPEAEVLDPPEMRDALRERLDEMRRRLAAHPADPA